MTDTVSRKALKQHVFHDGKSMVVLKEGKKGDIPGYMVNRFVEDGIIDGKSLNDAAAKDGKSGAAKSSDGAPAS